MRTPSSLLATALLLAACSASVNANPDDFYAPKLLSDPAQRSIVIAVEVGDRGGKKSFVKLFELYGFSGNGPSIEQVIKRNAPDMVGSFDSEGAAFVFVASSPSGFESARAKLKCVEEMKCLASWLDAAKSIPFKE